MKDIESKVESNRQLLLEAQSKGLGATLLAYTRLSGPGWLQSAITLGGGSLAGALFLGVLGGTNLLWLQLVAILMGVIMLSAISYVTLSTGERPFQAINQHINPVLGWGWRLGTVTAIMIWCMPQFGLCFAALENNLVGSEIVDNSRQTKLTVSAIILTAASFAVFLSSKQGLATKIFDLFLKALIATIVICFFGVVVYLTKEGLLNWGDIFSGFVPDLSAWSRPTGEIAELLQGLPTATQEYWAVKVTTEQRAVMIGAAATAVGINMTFLMPYSMLSRGWDKPFRGLARFDLGTGMAIPYILVTSCVVIAAASKFHAQADADFLSEDPAVMASSVTYSGAERVLAARLEHELGREAFAALSDDERRARYAALPKEEKLVVSSLVPRDAFQLSKALSPLLGENIANLVFGLGIFGMGFSTIMILMLINGYAFCEAIGRPQGGVPHMIGCLLSGGMGAIWPLIWDGQAKLWLAILVSAFGMMLLPIAYFTFFMMLNSKSLMGAEKPTGFPLLVWNVLMSISVLGAIVAAGTAIYDKANNPTVGPAVMGVAGVFVVLTLLGFFLKPKDNVAGKV